MTRHKKNGACITIKESERQLNMDNKNNTVLSVHSLKKLFRNGRGVNNITLNVNEGDIVGLLGPNGSGKTTAMKSIIGMNRIDEGEIQIFGYDIDDDFESAMESVGCLIETPALYDRMSAYQNLKAAARFYKYPDKRTETEAINNALSLVGLDKYSKDKAGSFSLGMRQRLGIALALLPRPRLVILDEPTNGLDIEGVVHIRSVIKEMSEKNKTTFLISGHVASELEKLCDKVAVIYDGRLLAMNSMEEVLENFPSLEDYFLSIVGNAKDTERRRVI